MLCSLVVVLVAIALTSAMEAYAKNDLGAGLLLFTIFAPVPLAYAYFTWLTTRPRRP